MKHKVNKFSNRFINQMKKRYSIWHTWKPYFVRYFWYNFIYMIMEYVNEINFSFIERNERLLTVYV